MSGLSKNIEFLVKANGTISDTQKNEFFLISKISPKLARQEEAWTRC